VYFTKYIYEEANNGTGQPPEALNSVCSTACFVGFIEFMCMCTDRYFFDDSDESHVSKHATNVNVDVTGHTGCFKGLRAKNTVAHKCSTKSIVEVEGRLLGEYTLNYAAYTVMLTGYPPRELPSRTFPFTQAHKLVPNGGGHGLRVLALASLRQSSGVPDISRLSSRD
jgi:hypothetical protein